ncbi:MAG: CPBP family intramembrane metalloprotease [Candidatus Dependentiae bacterium]|nr:CPBP family intramembrane metalloprotease [Candidatus Dependentiae bacterium]
MNRSQALSAASELGQKYEWLPATYKQVATFKTDDKAQIFVELACGGVQTFNDMMKKDLYMPYYWEVRHYKEHDQHEVSIYFKPDGTPYCFKQIVAEQDPGADLTEEAARAIAEKGCKDWNIDLSAYTLIEKSKQISPSKRSDHTFVYQRTHEKIGDGFYRLELDVAGDKLTEVMHYIKIPEAFSLRYKEMRSANTSISTAATIAMIILYIFGSIITILFFMRYDFVKPLGIIAALIIALLQFLSQLSRLPLIWAHYNTAIGSTNFLVSQFVGIIFSFCIQVCLYIFVFSVAEALTRKAFGHHIQLWKLWSPNVASSWQVWGRTLGGYLIVPLDIIFSMLVYIIAQKYFGWWVPAGTLTDPNILAEYTPWLSAFSNALTAGFLEECLFRAIPLASAALWGERFGKKKLFIFLAFIIQIIIFGAAHANYATQPSYARLLELIVPSSIFGLLYLVFGLLPAIISHVIFDVFWFALPLFISHAPGAWLNQSLVIFLSLIPIFVIIYARIRYKSWHTLSSSAYNKAYEYSVKKAHTFVEEAQIIIHKRVSRLLLIVGMIGAFTIGISIFMTKNYAPNICLSRTDAIVKAEAVLAENGVTLSHEWEPFTVAICDFINNRDQHLYVWQTAKKLYEPLMGSYLSPTHWLVRFVRFNGTVSERAEEYQVYLSDSGNILKTYHILPENRAGKSLSKEEARILAIKEIESKHHLSAGSFKEISAKEIVHPARKDWLFTFADTTYPEFNKDETRIQILIAGDQVVYNVRFINPPEEWKRTQQNISSLVTIIKQISLLFCIVIFLSCFMLFSLLYSHSLSLTNAFYCALTLILFYAFTLLNNWPAVKGSFSTAAPVSHQVFKSIGMSIVYSIFLTAALTFIISLVTRSSNAHTSKKNFGSWVIGILVGIIMTGAEFSTGLLTKSAQPLWADFSSLGSYFPIGIAIQTFIAWLFISCAVTMFMFALEYLHKHFRINRYALATVALVTLIIFNASRSFTTTTPLNLWILQQVICATVFLLLYEWYLRYDYALIGVALATGYSVMLIQQALFNAYPLAQLGSLLGIVMLIMASWFWFKMVNRMKK